MKKHLLPSLLMLSIIVSFISACASVPPPAPANTLAPTIAGPGETFSTAQAPPPTWRAPSRVITRENVFNIQLLGRFDFTGTPSTIFTYAFSPDGTRIAGLNNTHVVAWDLITGQFVISNTHRNAQHLFYGVDKTELFVVLREGIVAIYDANRGIYDEDFLGHDRFNGIAAYDTVNGWLALGGSDGTIRVWDTVERKALAVISAHETEIAHLLFSPDGTRLLSSGTDGRNYLWDWRGRQIVKNFSNEGLPTIRLAYHPSGERVAIATNEVITIWDVTSGEFIHGLPTEIGGSESLLMFSPDGRFLVNGGAIPSMMVWSGEGDNRFLAYLPKMGAGRIAATFSPDSTLLLTSKFEGETVLWDMTQITDETIVRANINPSSTRVVFNEWSPDGFTILFFDASGSIYVWGLPQD
ncbi:MAG: hypothetical protein CUN52_07465 [Phototrophicales bacterium]|nr:MAG: hypothetical protein CUN52_07465 [Phototrophicales bacterium]